MIKFNEKMIPVMESVCRKWLAISTSTERANRPQAEKGIGKLWGRLDQPPITKFIWADNPESATRIASNLSGKMPDAQIMDYCGGGLWAGYYGFYDFFKSIGVTGLEKIQILIDIAESCGWWYVVGSTAICTERPSIMTFNSENRCHNSTGPAIQYPDGWAIYALNGVTVPEYIVMTPANDLDPKCLLTETNAEVRREIERKIGSERILAKLGGKLIDQWIDPAIGDWCDYELYELAIPGMSVKPRLLKMKNPSIGIYESNWASTQSQTVKEELARRNKDKKYIQPIKLT